MFVIIVHSINLQPNIIHVSSNSSVFVCRVAGNYVLLPKTSIHMSVRVKHERADSSAGPKDLKVTTKFIYATPTDVYNVRRNGLRKIQEKKGSRHSANTRDPPDSHSVNQQTGTGPGRSACKEKHGFESKRRLMETNTWKAAMRWSYTDESRTSIQRWEAAVLSSGWTCSGWVISCRCMAQRREPAVSSTQVRSERERLTITILREIVGETRRTVTIRICVLEPIHQVSLGPGTTHKDSLSLSPAYFGQILNHHLFSHVFGLKLGGPKRPT